LLKAASLTIWNDLPDPEEFFVKAIVSFNRVLLQLVDILDTLFKLMLSGQRCLSDRKFNRFDTQTDTQPTADT